MAQYGSCFPIVFLLGKFLARSTIATSVPITGPSTDMSAKMPAVCVALRMWDAVFVVMAGVMVMTGWLMVCLFTSRCNPLIDKDCRRRLNAEGEGECEGMKLETKE